MNKLFSILFLCSASLAFAQSTNYATRVNCEVQSAYPELRDLVWLQGTTPAVQAVPMNAGKPLAYDTSTSVRMIIGPTATGTVFAVRTNATAVTNGYTIQWPTIGTNSSTNAWFYTILFDRAGNTYWSGSGRIYIDATTSTASNGLDWIEYTIPNVDWANIVGNPESSTSLVAYVSAHAGGTVTNMDSRYLKDGDTFTSLYTSTSNAFTDSQVPSAGWVRSLVSSGKAIYFTTNRYAASWLPTNTTAIGSYDVPPVEAWVNFGVTGVGHYVATMVDTNPISAGIPLVGPATIHIGAYTAGGALRSLSVAPELYYTYDLNATNLTLGDFSAAAQAITVGVTNDLTFSLAWPNVTPTSTYYRVFRLRCSAKGQNTTNVFLAVNGSHASYVRMQESSVVVGGNVSMDNVIAPFVAGPQGRKGFAIWQSDGVSKTSLTNYGGLSLSFSLLGLESSPSVNSIVLGRQGTAPIWTNTPWTIQSGTNVWDGRINDTESLRIAALAEGGTGITFTVSGGTNVTVQTNGNNYVVSSSGGSSAVYASAAPHTYEVATNIQLVCNNVVWNQQITNAESALTGPITLVPPTNAPLENDVTIWLRIPRTTNSVTIVTAGVAEVRGSIPVFSTNNWTDTLWTKRAGTNFYLVRRLY